MSPQSLVEKILGRVYKPKKHPANRNKLLLLSLIVFVVCCGIAITQYYFHWARETIWTILFIFFPISILGVFISRYGSDFWVSLYLGEV